MFHINTDSTRWRRLAVTGLALPLALTMSGTALASGPAADLQLVTTSDNSSGAVMTIDVDCFTVSVTSDKDISNVKVTFADGSFQEIEGLSGPEFERTFTKEIASATSKSGTTTVSDAADGCAVEVEAPVKDEDEAPVKDDDKAPVKDDDKAPASSSEAVMAIVVDCFTVGVTSDKDISNVKVTFADGSFQEIEGLSGLEFERTFTKEIASATSKSGTTTVSDAADGCAVEVAAPVKNEDEAPVKDENKAPAKDENKAPVKDENKAPVKDDEKAPTCPDAPVMGPVMEGCEGEGDGLLPGNGTADISIAVECRNISVQSDKDISNVKVTFVDGSFQEIEGLSGLEFERTFDKDIESATAKSATTTVSGTAQDCVIANTTPVQNEDATPVQSEDAAPVCPDAAVMGPVMEGCETAPVRDQTPVQDGTPVQEDAPVRNETPAPVEGQTPPQAGTGDEVTDETDEQAPAPEVPVAAVPIANQTPAQPALGGGAAEATTSPAVMAAPTAVAPAGVLANAAFAPAAMAAPAPVVTAQVSPTTLPFTGDGTAMLTQLGLVLVAAGGAAAMVGRRERVLRTA